MSAPVAFQNTNAVITAKGLNLSGGAAVSGTPLHNISNSSIVMLRESVGEGRNENEGNPVPSDWMAMIEKKIALLTTSLEVAEEKRKGLENTVATLRSELIDEVKRRRALEKKIAQLETQENQKVKSKGRKSVGLGSSRRSAGNPPQYTPDGLPLKDEFFNWLDSKNLAEFKVLWDEAQGKPKGIAEYFATCSNPTPNTASNHPSNSSNPPPTGSNNSSANASSSSNLNSNPHTTSSELSTQIYLEKSPKTQIIEFIFLQEDAPIRELWNHKKFIQDFILTYLSFMSTKNLFEELADRCAQGSSSIILVRDFLSKYVEFKKMDLLADPLLPKSIEKFAKKLEFVNKDVATEITFSLTSALKQSAMMAPPQESLVKGLPQFLKTYDVLEFQDDPVEIARQMTLLEQKYFQQIDSKELLNKAWTSEKMETKFLNSYINYTNHVSTVISTEILSRPTPKLQARTISLWINVAQKCHKMNNFSSLGQILGSLHSSSISKLKFAWLFVSKKDKEELDRLTKHLSLKNHFEAYHTALSNLDPETTAVIPLVAATMHNLMYIEELFETTDPKGYINWKKMSKVADSIWEIRKFKLRYNFYPIPDIQDYFTHIAPVWDDSDIAFEIAKLRTQYNEVEFVKLPLKPTTTNTGVVVDIFKHHFFTDVELDYLIAGTQSLNITPGKVLISKDEPMNFIYVIKSGEFNVECTNHTGKKTSIGKFGPKMLLGVEALLIDSPANQIANSVAWCTSTCNSTVFRIEIEQILKILSGEDKIFSNMNLYLAVYLATIYQANHQNYMLNEYSDQYYKTKPPTPHKSNSQKNVLGAWFRKKTPLFGETFGLPDEVPIKQFSGALRIKAVTSIGILFVSQNYICFSSSGGKGLFKYKVIIEIDSIISIGNTPKGIRIIRTKDGEKENFTFFGFENAKEVSEFLISFCLRKQGKSQLNIQCPPVEPNKNPASPNFWTLTSGDWKKIHAGSRELAFDVDEQIISEYEVPYRAYFQIIEGCCHLKKNDKIIGKLEKGDIFDEVAMLLNTPHTDISVVAAAETKVRMIEGYYLDVLFLYEPSLSGKFYNFLASYLANNLNSHRLDS
eukprot:TRINITY_DN3109_c0_g1_i2.p1 TRINITY_DN3109_c0_g1~~TRINITY_DN3109_c0_g1_i2.p1  ORF type:complete len:1082 (+),score=234.95 TRINITY_DN3109_c0_g1_i2:2010-5255(+)